MVERRCHQETGARGELADEELEHRRVGQAVFEIGCHHVQLIEIGEQRAAGPRHRQTSTSRQVCPILAAFEARQQHYPRPEWRQIDTESNPTEPMSGMLQDSRGVGIGYARTIGRGCTPSPAKPASFGPAVASNGGASGLLPAGSLPTGTEILWSAAGGAATLFLLRPLPSGVFPQALNARAVTRWETPALQQDPQRPVPKRGTRTGAAAVRGWGACAGGLDDGGGNAATILWSELLLQMMTGREICDVLAHEIIRVRNGDLTLIQLAMVVGRLTRVLSEIALMLVFSASSCALSRPMPFRSCRSWCSRRHLLV